MVLQDTRTYTYRSEAVILASIVISALARHLVARYMNEHIPK